MSLSRRALLVVAPLLASPVPGAESKKPQLDLRVMPRVGLPSTEFLFVADLKGGPETEALYCPTLVWEWGPQQTSVEEPECPPFQPGVTRIERRFSASRTFAAEGERRVTLLLRKDGKPLARASASFRVAFEKGRLKGTSRDSRS